MGWSGGGGGGEEDSVLHEIEKGVGGHTKKGVD